MAQRAQRITGKAAHVIYPSLEETFGVKVDPAGSITMINANRVKGVDTFLEIARRMADRNREAEAMAFLGYVGIASGPSTIAAGVDASTAFSAVLLYRIVTYWLPIPAGWFALQHLQARDAI